MGDRVHVKPGLFEDRFAPFAERLGLSMLPFLVLPPLLVLVQLLPRVPRVERLHERGAAAGFSALRP